MRAPSHWKRILAEFLAIFAGVVLGLLADDWREARQDRERESFALQEILADLKGDSAELASFDRQARDWNSAGLWVAKHRGVSVPADSVVNAIRPVYFTYVYRPQHAAYVGLRDAGELDLIRDRALRRQLVDYFETQQPYAESLYQRTNEMYFDAGKATRAYFRLTVTADAQSLRGDTGLELLRPWLDASRDQEFTAAVIMLGVGGATVALRLPDVRKANASLMAAIAEHIR